MDALSLSWENLDPYAFPLVTILGKVGREVAGLPVQHNNYVHPLGGGHIIFALSGVPLGFQTF